MPFRSESGAFIMFKKLMAHAAILAVIVGIGYPPPAMDDKPRGRLLARVAAMTDVFRQTEGAPFRVLSESYAGGYYVVRAEENVL